MDISIKFQMLAIGILLITMVDFIFSKKLPLISTRTFELFWGACFVNLIADIGSYYTLTHMETVSPWLNRLMHQLYIGSLDVIIYLLFVYVCLLCGVQKRMPKLLTLGSAVPCIISLIFVVFGELEYIVDANGAYSRGSMAGVMYMSVALYIIAIFVMLFLRRKRRGLENSELLPNFKKARVTIIVGLCIWIFVALVQYITSYWLISAAGVSLMVLYVYVRFENPREYIDSETETLNRRAFHIMLPEMFARKKPFYMINFNLGDIESIQKSMGYDMTREIIKQAAVQIGSALPRMSIYHSRSNSLTAFLASKEELDKIIRRSEQWDFRCRTSSGDGIYSPVYHLTVIECPKYAQTPDEAYETLDYCVGGAHCHHESGKIYFIDEAEVEKRNYRKSVISILNDAVRNKAFNVVYQPIYSAEKKRYASAEALVRLQDSTTVGFISPEYFIPLAEEQGLIGEIGHIVFEKVCSFAAREKLWQLGIDYIEVNLSAVQSVDVGIVAELSRMMTKYGVHPGFFNLEITETASVDGGDMLLHNMEQFRKLGCHFSMDDFGTGYSNLAQMARVHFELIKLDKSLIWPCFGEEPTEPMVILNSCIDMILRLGAHIVAEGVETKEQADLLISKGVNYLQGYYFCRPVPEADFVKAVKEMLAQSKA